MADWTIQPFGTHHDRGTFTCGNPSLDDFIRARVSQYEKRRLGKTFVAVPTDETRVIGYYTLAAGAIAFNRLPPGSARKRPKHPVPVVLLARLAVDQTSQGQRVGERLLLDALQRTFDLSAELGVHAIKVDAVDNTAAAFYCKYGFTPLIDDPLQLYLPISIVEDLLG